VHPEPLAIAAERRGFYTRNVTLGLAPPAANNITEGASLYSTLASVLAGFAFTAIVLLVVTWLSNSAAARQVLASTGTALVASFFGLIIMSVAYASEATNTSNNGFTVSQNTILGAGFVGVGVLVLYTVVLMLDAADRASRPAKDEKNVLQKKPISGTAREAVDSDLTYAQHGSPRLWEVARFGRICACIVYLLTFGIGENSVGLYNEYKYGPNASYPATAVLGWAFLTVEFMILVWAVWLIAARPRDPALMSSAPISDHLISYVGIGLAVSSGAGYLIADTTVADTSIIPAFAAVLILVTDFLATAGGIIFLVLTRPEYTDSELDGSPPYQHIMRRVWLVVVGGRLVP
jgi:hypothetical protein